MAANYEVILSDQAKLEFDGIFDYIAFVLLNPKAADDLLADFNSKFKNLGFMPHSYPKHDFDSDYHKCIVRNYIAFFLIDEEAREVSVEHIMYGGRDIKKHL